MQTVIIRWQQPVTFTEFKINCLSMLQVATENAATCWLFDYRSKGELTQKESEWLSQEFYPKALQLIAPQLLVAFLLTPRQMQRLQENKDLSSALDACPEVRYQAFLTEQDAVKWMEDTVVELVTKVHRQA